MNPSTCYVCDEVAPLIAKQIKYYTDPHFTYKDTCSRCLTIDYLNGDGKCRDCAYKSVEVRKICSSCSSKHPQTCSRCESNSKFFPIADLTADCVQCTTGWEDKGRMNTKCKKCLQRKPVNEENLCVICFSSKYSCARCGQVTSDYLCKRCSSTCVYPDCSRTSATKPTYPRFCLSHMAECRACDTPFSQYNKSDIHCERCLSSARKDKCVKCGKESALHQRSLKCVECHDDRTSDDKCVVCVVNVVSSNNLVCSSCCAATKTCSFCKKVEHPIIQHTCNGCSDTEPVRRHR